MHAVHDEVLGFIDDQTGRSFESLAHSVFAHQFELIESYRRYCTDRGRTPATVVDWRDIPAVPIEAFKLVDLRCAAAQRTFLSSGTTGGPTRRSRHSLPDLRLYRRSAVAGLRRFLLPDVERIRVLSLVHPVELLPDSSLAQMVAWTIEAFGDGESAYVVGSDGIAFEALVDHLRNAERTGQLLCIMTTTGALVRVLDYARDHDLAFRLPHGSRLMDTGGDKGAPRQLSRKGLLHACWNTFAIPGYFCVNEYGMAELSSQYYDNVIADRVGGIHRPRCTVGPPWMRTLIVDPETLQPAPRGTSGLICHFDLANAGTAMAVLSEDVGRAVESGFELIGRARGAELRGCSLTLAEWEAARAS